MYNIRFQSNIDKPLGMKKESSQRRRREKRNSTTVRDMRMITYDTTGAGACLLYTSPSPRDLSTSRMPSSA